MQINTEWIAVNFDRFNKDYFGGRLTPPKFSVNNARTRLGSMAFKWKRSLLKRESYDYVIRLSNYYDIPEVEFQNVLLHEMIHYYIAVNRFKDDSVHGTMFRSIAQRINKQGWNNTTDGKYFLSVIGPGSIQKVKLQITRTPQIREARWFETSDDYFQHFPQCRTLRGRIVTKDFWEEKVKSLSPVGREV